MGRWEENLIAKAARKRVEAAVANLGYYTFDGRSLYRKLLDKSAKRKVVPAGAPKAIIYNGRKRILNLGKRFLLEHHDCEATAYIRVIGAGD